MGRSRVKPYRCDVCGRGIQLSNLMKRYAVTAEGELIRTDTHQLTHLDAEIVSRERVQHAELLDPESRRFHYYDVVREGKKSA